MPTDERVGKNAEPLDRGWSGVDDADIGGRKLLIERVPGLRLRLWKGEVRFMPLRYSSRALRPLMIGGASLTQLCTAGWAALMTSAPIRASKRPAYWPPMSPESSSTRTSPTRVTQASQWRVHQTQSCHSSPTPGSS